MPNLAIDYGGRFRKDVKKLAKRGKKLAKLWDIVEALAAQQALPARCKPHILSGDWAGFWECHIEPDWLLIYRMTEDSLILIASGSHADLFG